MRFEECYGQSLIHSPINTLHKWCHVSTFINNLLVNRLLWINFLCFFLLLLQLKNIKQQPTSNNNYLIVWEKFDPTTINVLPFMLNFLAAKQSVYILINSLTTSNNPQDSTCNGVQRWSTELCRRASLHESYQWRPLK